MSDEDILRQLLSSGTSTAWEIFLRRFSNLILKIVWQSTKDYDEAMGKYLFVCTKLAEKDFALLRKYTPAGSKAAPQLATWLAAVAQNLCVDAHRATHGRKQLPRAILRLDEFDREVFRLYYWKGCSREELEQRLADRAEGNAQAVVESLERIQSAGPWMVPATRTAFVQFDEEDARFGSNEIEHERCEMLAWLERWLDGLDDRARMAVRLWFWEEMTAREIAEAMRIFPEQRVYTLLRAALARLREHAEQTYRQQRSSSASVYNQQKEA